MAPVIPDSPSGRPPGPPPTTCGRHDRLRSPAVVRPAGRRPVLLGARAAPNVTVSALRYGGMSCSVVRMDTTGIITAADLKHLRRVVDGIIVADAEGRPLVRSKLRYHGLDPLYDGVDQIVVLDGDPAWDLEDPATDKEIAEDLSAR